MSGTRGTLALALSAATIVVAVSTFVALAGGWGRERLAQTQAGAPSQAQSDSRTAPRFFSTTSFWNTQTPREAPLDPESELLVGALAAEVERELSVRYGPGISTTRYAVPIYTVPAEQPAVRVELTTTNAPALQAAFEQVPLPPEARPSGGTDANLVVWQPATDRLWEFWRFARGPEGPQAAWGGAMQDVSSGPGVYGPGVWPGSQPWWGSSASSLSIAGGLITLEEMRRGRIDHALAAAVPGIRAGVYAWPARRSDGESHDPRALPEGAHLRLDPDLDLRTLPMPRVTRMIAEAAQRYGIYVRDGASAVHFFAEDPVTTGDNPYTGPNGYFEGRYPGELLEAFPWERLQVLEMELHPDER